MEASENTDILRNFEIYFPHNNISAITSRMIINRKKLNVINKNAYELDYTLINSPLLKKCRFKVLNKINKHLLSNYLNFPLLNILNWILSKTNNHKKVSLIKNLLILLIKIKRITYKI